MCVEHMSSDTATPSIMASHNPQPSLNIDTSIGPATHSRAAYMNFAVRPPPPMIGQDHALHVPYAVEDIMPSTESVRVGPVVEPFSESSTPGSSISAAATAYSAETYQNGYPVSQAQCLEMEKQSHHRTRQLLQQEIANSRWLQQERQNLLLAREAWIRAWSATSQNLMRCNAERMSLAQQHAGCSQMLADFKDQVNKLQVRVDAVLGTKVCHGWRTSASQVIY